MRHVLYKFSIALFACIFFTSCGTSKDIIYFQDEPLKNANIQPSTYELTYKIGDMLAIDVSGFDPETVRPFNLPAVSYSNSVVSAQGNLKMQTYLIDNEGTIQFPVIGSIALKGLTRTEAKAMLTSLGLAGDLTIYGRRDNILLIREVDGEKRFAKFDLTKINVLGSKNYYLTQNDVIYVEPNKAKARSSNYTQNNSVLIAAAGTLATIIAILIR